jgi:hypothetical protein
LDNPITARPELSWDNERRPTPILLFAIEKVCWGDIQRLRRVANNLDASPILNCWTEATVWTRVSSLYRIQSWDQNFDLFGLNHQGLGQSLLDKTGLTVSLPNFLKSGEENDYDIGGSYRHFRSYFVFYKL